MDFDEKLPGSVRLIAEKMTEDGRAFAGLVRHVAPDGAEDTKQYGWPIALRNDRQGLRRTIRALHREWLAARGKDESVPAAVELLDQDL